MDGDKKLRAAVSAPLERAGLELESVEMRGAGRARKLRVVVDLPEEEIGGVGSDQLAEASSAVSKALDDADIVDGEYLLEVTTPGISRPLTDKRHWKRARTRLVKAALAGGKAIEGRVVEVDDNGVLFDVKGKKRAIRWSDLGQGRVQVEFTRSGEE